jgi:shikimate kinase
MSPCRLFLVGYRGTGKTTVGRLVATGLGWQFVDADQELERLTGKSIAEIFATEGEVGFRGREASLLEELSQRDHAVIATGGGAVLRPSNRDRLAQGFVAWLTASPSVIWRRISADPDTGQRRPNLTASGGLEEVMTLLAAREPLYESVANIRISTDDRSPEAIAADILSAWAAYSPSPPDHK